jgi:carbon storage regulator
MLVLSRKPGEDILIDGRIRVRVIQSGNGRVRLGIIAPREVEVMRAEIAFDDQSQETCPQATPDMAGVA